MRLIGQDCAVEILHDAADDIDQRRVIRIFIVHEDRALTNNLQGLTDGILFAKESLGQSLRDDTFIRCIEGCQFISLKQIEIEETEECRVCEHDDAILLISFLHLSLTIFNTASLTHHATRLFHFWAHLFYLLCSLRPHKEILIITRQVDAVGILVPRINAVLPPGIVAHEDNEH